MKRLWMSVGLIAVNAGLMQAIAAKTPVTTPPPSLPESAQAAPAPTPPTSTDAPNAKPKPAAPTIKHGIIQPSAKPRALAEESEAPPVPLAPGSRVVASLDPKEDFIILGKEEPEPIEPAKPAMEAAADIAGGLGIMEPTRLTLKKAPVTVSPGIVPVQAEKPAVQVAGPNIGAEPVLHHAKPKAPAKKTSVALALNVKVKSTMDALTPPPKSLKSIKSVKVAQVVSHPEVTKHVKLATKPVKLAMKPIKQPIKMMKPVKPIAVHAVKGVKKTVLVSAKPKKGFVPVIHEFASYHPPKHKPANKVVVSQATKPHPVVKPKSASKMAVFKPVVKPFMPSHHAAKKASFKPVIKPYVMT